MSDMLKYDDSFLFFDTGHVVDVSPDFQMAIEKLNAFEEQVRGLAKQFESIGKDVFQFRTEYDIIAEQLENFKSYKMKNSASDDGTDSVSPFLSKRSVVGQELEKEKSGTTATGSTSVIGALLEGVGWLGQRIADWRNIFSGDKTQERQLEIATAQLQSFEDAYNELCSVPLNVIEQAYGEEFNKSIDLSDSSAVIQTLRFREVFSVIIRLRYLLTIAEYCIGEMKEWLAAADVAEADETGAEEDEEEEYEEEEGYDDEEERVIDVIDVLENEFSTWSSRLYGSQEEWDEMVSRVLYQREGEMPLPLGFVLAHPAIFRNFVGINIGMAYNCPNALIELTAVKRNTLNPLIMQNPYYQHCIYIYSTQYELPEAPSGFDFRDVLTILLPPIVYFMFLFLILHFVSSGFWRVFLIVPLSIAVGNYEYQMVDNYDGSFPYARRAMEYRKRMGELRASMAMYENVEDAHLI